MSVITFWDEYEVIEESEMNELEKIMSDLAGLPLGRRIYDRFHVIYGDHRWFLIYELGDEGISGAKSYLAIFATDDEALGDHPAQVFYERLRDSLALKIIIHTGGKIELYWVKEWIALTKTPEKDEDYLCIEWHGEEVV